MRSRVGICLALTYVSGCGTDQHLVDVPSVVANGPVTRERELYVVAKPTWSPFLLATGIASLAACGEPGERPAVATTEWFAVADLVVESSQRAGVRICSVPSGPQAGRCEHGW
jgi:hypothetical protein